MTGSASLVTFQVNAAEDGASIGGATVGLGLARDSTTHGTLQVGSTDDAGRVTFPIDPGANLASLFVCAPGRQPFQGAGRAKCRDGGAVAALPATVTLAPGLTFAGILRDARGHPVAGAHIGLIAEGPDWAGNGPGANFGREPWPPVTSDAEGRFAWCWFDPRWFDRDDARCSLTVDHERYVPTTIPLGDDLTRPGVRDVAAVLDEGCTLRVEVTDAAGQVRDDAEVEVCFATRGGAMSDSYRKTATRAIGGGWVARGLRPARHRVEARAPGCAPRTLQVDVARRSCLRLELGPGTRLEGVVRDGDDRPLPGEEVTLAAPWLSRRSFRACTTADADGRFAFDGLPRRGSFRLSAGMSCAMSVRLPSPPVVLRLRLLRFDLQIVDARTGAPLVEADVTYGQDGSSSGRRADDDGRVTFHLPPGLILLSVVAPGHAGTTRIFRATERAARRLRTVRLGTGRQLRGRVVDDHGAPLAGCRVTARHVFRSEHREVRTDSAGRFTLPNLRGRYWLGVHAAGVASRTLRVRVGRWLPPLPVRIRLGRA